MIKTSNTPSTDLQHGLSDTEVFQSRLRHGRNIITPAREVSPWQLLGEKFADPIIRILLFAALLSLVIGAINRNFTESIGIILAIILATCVGFLFEWDAQRRFRRLNQVNDHIPVKVLRNGRMVTVPRHEVVVGDVVSLESGETVPADGMLTEAVSLKINESTLTGEPEVDKTCNPDHFDPEATYPSNRLLRGTTVMDGYAMMLVDAVGDSTEAGRVTEQATKQTEQKTPLDRQLERLSTHIGRAGIWLSALIFVIMLAKAFFTTSLLEADWLTLSQTILHLFMLAVAIIVMAVPEGLPMSITLSLAMSMRRMLRTNNLVRKMHACETMGAVTVICTDKTGTLTQNRMQVQQVTRYGTMDNAALAEAIALNSTAFLDASGAVLGNPTEGALLQWLAAEGHDYTALRGRAEILDRMTFSPERKYMATLIRTANGRRLLTVKGAPEVVRQMCRPTEQEEAINNQLLDWQHHAMRTLAIAACETTAGNCREALTPGALELSALAAISDPIREEVPAAVRQCLEAGIAVKIVTGDTPATAQEIARQIGLWTEADGERNRLTGVEFAALSDEELLERVRDLKILSRARPLDKQRLVQLLQRAGEVVAVTGDGTNDAPALNFADVGLSMGSGTSVAKDASDITLLDDSFKSIAMAVMWGRSLYRNIQRFVLYQLTINIVAIVICFLSAVIGNEMPLTVVQILWVNIIMDTFAAMAMASLPPNPEVMRDKPRPANEFIITPAMARTLAGCAAVITVALLTMLFVWKNMGGWTPHRLTIFFSTFIFLQFWNMFNAKGFEMRHSTFTRLKGCREFFMILVAIGLGQWLIVTFGGALFQTTPLGLTDWAIVIGSTSLLAIGGDVLRDLRRS